MTMILKKPSPFSLGKMLPSKICGVRIPGLISPLPKSTLSPTLTIVQVTGTAYGTVSFSTNVDVIV